MLESELSAQQLSQKPNLAIPSDQRGADLRLGTMVAAVKQIANFKAKFCRGEAAVQSCEAI